MNMKFYMTPGSCSTGIHILLEEVGLVFEAYVVNLMAGDQHKPEYLEMNPKGTIPSLVTAEGHALTDFMTIAIWLAKKYPRRKLVPETLMEELQVLDVMNYAVNTIHGQGFTRIFTTDKYCQNPAEHEAIKATGHEIVNKAFKLVNVWLDGKEFVNGQFSIADAALFYVEFWAVRIDIPLPANCQRHYEAMLKRPSVRQVLAEEGYASAL